MQYRPSALSVYAGLDADQRGGFGDTTGRMIAVILDHDRAAMAFALARFSDQAGLKDVCWAADFTAAAIDPEQAEEADVIALEELGIAVWSWNTFGRNAAGITALIAQETELGGLPLYREMRRRARPHSDPRTDIGNGLIHIEKHA